MMDSTPKLDTYEVHGGRVEQFDSGRFRLMLPPITHGYADAQLDDYRTLARADFHWRPPLSLSLRARVSHLGLRGTFGFGFWNDPFSFSLGQGGAARRMPASPRALWFFYASPPSEMGLRPGAAPHGWKAVTLDTPTLPSLLLAPMAAGAAALAQIPFLRGPVMTAVLRQVRAHECDLDFSPQAWHDYKLEWSHGSATFQVDGETVLEAPHAPPGPLGFVAWIDNQYLIASPKGGFRFGVLPTEREGWLELERLSLTPREKGGS